MYEWQKKKAKKPLKSWKMKLQKKPLRQFLKSRAIHGKPINKFFPTCLLLNKIFWQGLNASFQKKEFISKKITSKIKGLYLKKENLKRKTNLKLMSHYLFDI